MKHSGTKQIETERLILRPFTMEDREGCLSDPEKEQKGAERKEGDIGMEKSVTQNIISDETIEYIGILAKLELSGEEKEQAKKDMERMLHYIGKLNELDTTDVEPMSHIFPFHNVFREDVVANGDDSIRILKNAPGIKDGSFKVPKTIEQDNRK